MKWKRKKAKNIEKKKRNNRKRKESSQMLKFSKNDAPHAPLYLPKPLDNGSISSADTIETN